MTAKILASYQARIHIRSAVASEEAFVPPPPTVEQLAKIIQQALEDEEQYMAEEVSVSVERLDK